VVLVRHCGCTLRPFRRAWTCEKHGGQRLCLCASAAAACCLLGRGSKEAGDCCSWEQEEMCSDYCWRRACETPRLRAARRLEDGSGRIGIKELGLEWRFIYFAPYWAFYTWAGRLVAFAGRVGGDRGRGPANHHNFPTRFIPVGINSPLSLSSNGRIPRRESEIGFPLPSLLLQVPTREKGGGAPPASCRTGSA